MENKKLIKILDISEICELLKISRPTLAGLPIPTVRIGKRIKYKYSDILQYLNKNTQSSNYSKIIASRGKIKTGEVIRKKIEKYKRQIAKGELV